MKTRRMLDLYRFADCKRAMLCAAPRRSWLGPINDPD